MQRDTQVVTALSRKFIPILVEREDGCEGCAAERGAPHLCGALPDCLFPSVIFKEVE